MTQEFKNILEKLEKTSTNAFITGRAGTGKSTLLKFFRTSTDKNIAVLAPTGVAALNVQGQTIHSFFRFKPGITEDQVKRIYGPNVSIYKKLDAIVIDEISMVRADLLDCVDKFLRINGPDSNQPFGGIQIITIGDLYQLPPVVTEYDRELFNTQYRSPYFFDARSFNDAAFETFELSKVFRQTDEQFIKILDAIRTNNISNEHLSVINNRVSALENNESEGFNIALVTTNAIADRMNLIEIDKLNAEAKIYKGNVSGDFGEKNLPTTEELALKVGAQVMMLNNDPKKRWANGDIAKVIELKDDSIKVSLENELVVDVSKYTWETVKFVIDNENGKVTTETTGAFTQFPIRLAWAVTIHKGQGKTFDRVSIDFGYGTFAPGQAYVALSRSRSLEGLTLKRPLRPRDVFIDPRVSEFMKMERPLKKSARLF